MTEADILAKRETEEAQMLGEGQAPDDGIASTADRTMQNVSESDNVPTDNLTDPSISSADRDPAVSAVKRAQGQGQ